jgi:hypothetical protein
VSSRSSFSVVVPCYRYGRYLERCLESIVTQRDVEVEVLVIDDASPDDSADVAHMLAARWPEVTVRVHVENAGHIRTFNEGLDWATADHVVLISADDLLAPGALSRAATLFDEHPEVGLVYGDVVVFEDGTVPVTVDRPDLVSSSVVAGWDWIEERCRVADNAARSPEVIVRNRVQQQVGHYDARCVHTSDFNMWMRVASVSDVAYVAGSSQACYRVHSSNMSRTAYRSKLVQIDQRRQAFASLWEQVPADARSTRLRAVASTAIAKTAVSEAIWCVTRPHDDADLSLDEEVAALDALARREDPAIVRTAVYREFGWRRRLGPTRSKWFPPFWALAGARWARRMKHERDLRRAGRF